MTRWALCIGALPLLLGCGPTILQAAPGGSARTAKTGAYQAPGELVRRAHSDCNAGRRVLFVGARGISPGDRLQLLAQIVGAQPGCEVVTATMALESPNWTYVSWLPDTDETTTAPGEPRPRPITVQEVHGQARGTTSDRGQFSGCAPGQTWIQLFPPGFSARKQQRVMAGLPPMPGCQKVAAVQDKLPRPQGRISLVYGVPTGDYNAGSPQDKLPVDTARKRRRKASFKPLSPAVTFRNGPYASLIRSARVGGKGRIWDQLPARGPTIVSMFASWCEACLKDEELSLVGQLARESKEAGIRFLNLADGTGKITPEVGKLKRHPKATNFVYPVYVIRDRLENLRDRVEPFEVGLPLFFVMSGRRVLAVRFGGLSDDVIGDLIDAAQAAPLPKPRRNQRLAEILKARRQAEAEEDSALADGHEIAPLTSTQGLEPVELKPEPAPPKPAREKKPKPSVEAAAPEPPSPPMPAKSKWGWGLIGGAAALLGAATATWVAGENRVEPFRSFDGNGVNEGGSQTDALAAEEFSNAMRGTTLAFGILGIAAAATGIALLATGRSGKGTVTTGDAQRAPTLTVVPTGAGAALGVSF